MIPVPAGKCRFRALFPADAVLLGVQLITPFLFGFLDLIHFHCSSVH
jgi:hypothetical protein